MDEAYYIMLYVTINVIGRVIVTFDDFRTTRLARS